MQRAFSDFIGFSRASAAWRFNSSGVLVQDVANVARDDFDPVSGLWNGLLIEEARTNVIRNNSMTGSAAGTPGVFPNNWGLSTLAGGLTQTIVGSGVESGIPYLDIRVSGTAGASGVPNLAFEITTGAAALSGQTWTQSFFAKLASGSLANVTLSPAISERDNAGGFLATPVGSGITPASGPLAAQRFSYTRTLSNASTAFAMPLLQIGYSSGAVIDFTLRIGAPQLELGAFVTSPILTTNAQVTRAADTAMVGSLPPWFNPNEGTLYAEFISGAPANASTGSLRIFQLDDGTSNNRITLARGTDQKTSFATFVGGTSQANLVSAADTVSGIVYRMAAAFKASDFALSISGSAPIAASSGSLPQLSALRLGSSVGSSFLNGWLRALKYAPRRMTNAELQAMTTLPNANGPTLAFDFKAQTYNLEHI